MSKDKDYTEKCDPVGARYPEGTTPALTKVYPKGSNGPSKGNKISPN